jgi:cell division protein ZapA
MHGTQSAMPCGAHDEADGSDDHGQSYVLGCPEGGETALLEAVDQVDREMSAIRDGGKVRARERIAVLAALNLAYALSGKRAPAHLRAASESLRTLPRPSSTR